MQTTVKGTRPFQICLVDYIDLPKTRCGFQYGLTILCTFTKWLICVPSRLHRAIDTVNAIQRHLLDRFPQPEVIRSDRGRHFINSMCREFSQINGFDWRFHVSYHPQSCGALEVQHRVLKNALFILCHELRCEWIEVLPAVLQKLNALPNSSTGISLFEAVWGRRPELTNFDAVSNGVTSTDVPTFVRKQSDAMKIIHDKIKLCQERHDSASIRRNKPVHEPEWIEVGSQCLLKRSQSATARQTKAKSLGPYTCLANNGHMIKLSDLEGTCDWYHRGEVIPAPKRLPHLGVITPFPLLRPPLPKATFSPEPVPTQLLTNPPHQNIIAPPELSPNLADQVEENVKIEAEAPAEENERPAEGEETVTEEETPDLDSGEDYKAPAYVRREQVPPRESRRLRNLAPESQ